MNNAACYDEFSMQTSYVGESGVYAMPLAGGPGVPAVVLGLHAPKGSKVIVWRAKRTGGKPKVPHPTSDNPNDVLRAWRITVTCPSRFVDSTAQVQIEGEYVYEQKLPPWLDDGFPMGKQPVDSGNAADYVLTAADFDPTLLATRKQAPKSIKAPDLAPGFVAR